MNPSNPRSKDSGRIQLACGVMILAALAIRLVWALKLGTNVGFGDEQEYLDGARRLLAGEPLPRKNWMFFVRAPGYSAFIALIWKVIGRESLAAIRVAQAFLSTGTCIYIWAATRLITRRPAAALLALGLSATYPYHIFYCASLGTETLFAFLVVSGTYHLAVGIRGSEPAYRQVVAGALLLSFGNLARPNLSTLLPLLGAWVLWRWFREPKTVARLFAAMVIPLLVTTLPWSISAHRAGMGWIWVTDGGGVWYFMGHNDDSYRLYCGGLPDAERKRLLKFTSIDQFSLRPEFREAQAAPVPEQQRVFWRRALAWDREHPSKLPCLMAHKFTGFWRPWVNPDGYGRQMVLISMAALPVLAFGLLGLFWAWRAGERTLSVLVFLNIVTATAVAVLFSTEIRYRIPLVDPLLMPYAGYALSTLWRRQWPAKQPVAA
jgi:hypothetical protein